MLFGALPNRLDQRYRENDANVQPIKEVILILLKKKLEALCQLPGSTWLIDFCSSERKNYNFMLTPKHTQLLPDNYEHVLIVTLNTKFLCNSELLIKI